VGTTFGHQAVVQVRQRLVLVCLIQGEDLEALALTKQLRDIPILGGHKPSKDDLKQRAYQLYAPQFDKNDLLTATQAAQLNSFVERVFSDLK
jgi:hypothetical protein